MTHRVVCCLLSERGLTPLFLHHAPGVVRLERVFKNDHPVCASSNDLMAQPPLLSQEGNTFSAVTISCYVSRAMKLADIGLRLSAWFERWFPDAFALACVAVAVVFLASVAIGNSPVQTAQWFGAGFWDLVAFTMQMTMIVRSEERRVGKECRL